MNPFFVVLLILILLYRYFNLPNIISSVLLIVKYSQMAFSLLMPPKRGSVEYIRGGVLKIRYLDPNQTTGEDNHSRELSVILSYSVPAKHWDKVLLVTEEALEAYYRIQAEKIRAAEDQKAIEEAQERSPSVERLEIVHDLASDISDIAGTEVDPLSLAIPRSSPPKEASVDSKTLRKQVRECKKEDVTNIVLTMAGPGKDFFGIPLEIRQLFPHAIALIFIFGKRSKTFLSHEIIDL